MHPLIHPSWFLTDEYFLSSSFFTPTFFFPCEARLLLAALATIFLTTAHMALHIRQKEKRSMLELGFLFPFFFPLPPFLPFPSPFPSLAPHI
ncbi:hypothetical protein F4805DRAFT_451415 [Annulohypoxylon moriforme]|nr:hypothetical protein F4805DRAFT_451415 [Annulohypoxylon moriforme]